jgi:DNA-binding Lrp family transcriptional regulator
MVTTAYILIETAAGKASEVSDALNALPEVVTVDAVIGPYDIIAVTNTEGQNTVGDLVISKVHVITGIVRTVTCLAVNPSTE